MSVHKFRLKISGPAKRDFRYILNYTIQTWGDRQANIYHTKVQKALSAIAENPRKGKETLYGLRVVLAEKHKIFYLIKGDTVFVVRILDQRMDEGRHLS